jgi:hypothetical protein
MQAILPVLLALLQATAWARQPELRGNQVHRKLVGQITNFRLINTATNKTIVDPLVNGAVVNLAALSTTSLSVEAVRDVSSEAIGSVIFAYNGKPKFRTENGAPYAMCGDISGNFTTCTQLVVGVHSLTATPYSLGGGLGTAGSPVTVSFTIVNGAPTAPTPTAPTPTAPIPTAPTPTAPIPTAPTPTAPVAVPPTTSVCKIPKVCS